MNPKDRRAVGLYAVLARDPEDFIDMVGQENDPNVIQTLYAMLTLPNPDPKHDKELNRIGAGIVKGAMKRLGLVVPTDAPIVRSDS